MPQFSPGESKTAIVPMTNPTTKPFDYSAELYMGTELALMAETPFHLNAYEAKDISLPVVMPTGVGTYPVYIGVFSNGQFIEPVYKAEDVVIVGAPAFAYVSDVRCYNTGRVAYYQRPVWRAEIDIKNTGSLAGVCSVKLYWRENVTELGVGWSDWAEAYDLGWGIALSATLQPGETKTFWAEFKVYRDATLAQVYFTGSPGTTPTKEVEL